MSQIKQSETLAVKRERAERAQLPAAYCRHRKIRSSPDYGICVILGQMKGSVNVDESYESK